MSFPKNYMLMTPGPSEVYPEILALLARPPAVHYGQEWGELYKETCLSLRPLFGTEQEPLLLFGSGSLVMEMAIANLMKPGDSAVNVVTGYFGKRWEEVLRFRHVNPVSVSADLGQAVAPEVVEKAFRDHEDAKALVVSHVDTSSGVTSPLSEYAQAAKKHGAMVIVDAISSFGGIPVEMDKWSIDFCVGYPSKCLSSISGVTPFVFSEAAWERIQSEEHDAGWYTNLKVIKRFTDDWGRWGHPYPTTIPTQPVIALREAVNIVEREGLENCFARHRRAGRAVRGAAKALGLKPVAAEDVASPTVSPIVTGNGLDKEVQSTLLDRYGIQVGGGLLAPMIRVGHMGRTANAQYILATISALEGTLGFLGRSVKPGAGLEAAQKELTA